MLHVLRCRQTIYYSSPGSSDLHHKCAAGSPVAGIEAPEMHWRASLPLLDRCSGVQRWVEGRIAA